jgi:(R,R)-butanediol dehydrogenase / meso-butanediol dehydrogenase / diacetyl reductase
MPTTSTTPGTMRAARFHGNRDVRVESVPIPTLPSQDTLEDSTSPSNRENGVETWKTRPRAIVEVAWCGICGSDLHEFNEGELFRGVSF